MIRFLMLAAVCVLFDADTSTKNSVLLAVLEMLRSIQNMYSE